MLFAPGWTWSNILIGLGFLCGAAPFLRYLLGVHYLATGSLLAVGLQHAAFNASAALGDGGWQYIAGLVVLTVLVAMHRTVTRGGSTRGDAAAATLWLTSRPSSGTDNPKTEAKILEES